MIIKIEHVTLVTSNIKDAIDFYSELLECERPNIIPVDGPDASFKAAGFSIGPTGDTRLQFIQPSRGTGVEELRRGGEGALHHICFQVDNIESLYDFIVNKGITPVTLEGGNIEGKFLLAPDGKKFFYLPESKTRGTRIEVQEFPNP